MSPFNHGITKPSWEVPRNSESSMELGSILVTKFHGIHVEFPYPVGKLHGIPWNYENSMERRVTKFHGIFHLIHGTLVPPNTIFIKFHGTTRSQNQIITEFHGISCNFLKTRDSMELWNRGVKLFTKANDFQMYFMKYFSFTVKSLI